MDETVPDSAIREKQEELNRLYDSFTEKHGLINSRGNKLAFSDDSSYFLLCALEVMDDVGNFQRKADMFTKRTIQPHRVVTSVDTASEALTLSIAEKAEVDMAYMSTLTGKTAEELASELHGVIFHDPTLGNAEDGMGWVTADEYLSGNVRQKLRQAEAAAAENPAYQINVEALRAAQPKDLDASEIEVRLGATWIDKSYIKQFMFETFDTPFYSRSAIDVQYSPYTAAWNISGKTQISDNDIAAWNTYGTSCVSAYEILEDSLNLRDVQVYDTIEDADGKKKRVLNARETTLASQKQQLIRDAFKDWIWAEPNRRQALVRQYNEEMNSTRPREYDGSHIVFAGMNPEITLREHQRNAIAHVLYSLTVLGEVESLREEKIKHFRLSDGSFVAVSYGMPVHYQDSDGQWQDIDNSLLLEAESLETANECAPAAFSRDLAEGEIFTASQGDYSVSMSLLDTVEPVALTAEKANVKADMTGVTAPVEDRIYDRAVEAAITDEVPTMLQLQEKYVWDVNDVIPEKLQSSLVYREVFPGIDLLYTAFGYNIKEQIVVNEPQSAYRFDFLLETDGLSAVLNSDGSMSFLDEDGEAHYEIPAPYMVDAAGVYSDRVSYTLGEDARGYVLTVEADEEWINDEEREFPVNIDPTLAVVSGQALQDIYSVYTMEAAPNDTTLGRQWLYVGAQPYSTSNDGRYRIYMHFQNMPSIPSGSEVVHADLSLYKTAYCNLLFEIEQGLAEKTAEERYSERLKQAKPVLDALWSWANSRTAAPKSALGKALNYLKEQWPYLTNYLKDGRLELSNILCRCS